MSDPTVPPSSPCCACSGVPPSLQQMEPLHLQQAWLDKGRHRGVLFPTVLFYPCGPVARRGALQAQKSASALQCFSTASCCLALLATASEWQLHLQVNQWGFSSDSRSWHIFPPLHFLVKGNCATTCTLQSGLLEERGDVLKVYVPA